MNDLWTSEAKAISRAWTWNRVTPICAILLAILSVAIGGGSGRMVASVESPLMPLADVIVEGGDYEGTCLMILWVERYAGGKEVGSTTVCDVVWDVEI